VKRLCIADCVAYFKHIDPIHPFLDRQQFESVALSSCLGEKLANDKSWSALFYAVLALGSQYHDGGSYQPTKSESWRFFATALAIFPDLLITRTTLNTVQALTAMAIFASNVSCFQIEYSMVSEGAKKAQTLGYNRSTCPGKIHAIERSGSFIFWKRTCLSILEEAPPSWILTSAVPSQLKCFRATAYRLTGPARRSGYHDSSVAYMHPYSLSAFEVDQRPITRRQSKA
jgi:hypothetical protein